MLQQGYGSGISIDNVVFSESDQAIIYANLPDESMMVNLTTLAEFRADGTIRSDEDLKRDWLKIGRLN